MTGLALDYSAGFPGAQAIRQLGYAGAVRYFGYPGRAKCTTAGELAAFSANQLGMAGVFEDTAGVWRGGYGRGVGDGIRARNFGNAIGFPSHRPIYAAIDEDVVTAAEFDTVIDYLRGYAANVGGAGLAGVYGEADVIDAARNAGVVGYHWQTKAWSHGRKTAANLRQNIGTVYVGGIACDTNEILTPDWGQHNLEDDMAWSDELSFVIPDGPRAGETVKLSAAQWLTWTNWWVNKIPGLEAGQAALIEAIAHVSTSPDITPEALQQMLNNAVAQHINITGTINIGPANPSP